jgi:hypothetical protein
MMCGPLFIEYDGTRYNELVRGGMDEAEESAKGVGVEFATFQLVAT